MARPSAGHAERQEADISPHRFAGPEPEGALDQASGRRRPHLVYQPIVRLPAGPAIGVEALLRWTNPDPGAVSFARTPSGVPSHLGDWGLAEAAGQAAEWRRQSPAMRDLVVSVDVSAAQRHDSDVVGQVGTVLAATGLPGSALCLEFGEAMLLDDPVGGRALLKRLRRLEVGIAIERFGLDCASLAHLGRLAVTVLKIDASLIAGAARPDSADATLLAAMVAMSQRLGMVTVACGVATAAQAARLAELGCDAGQGDELSPPVAADELPHVVARLAARNRGLASA